MAVFRFRAYTTLGDLSEGEIEARSREEAEETLWTRGLTPFETREIRAAGESALSRRLFGERGPTRAELASFTREFATLEQADVPLDQCFRIISMQNSSPALRNLADGILRQILDGASLSDALVKRPEVFANDYVNMVRAGEMTGNIASALTEIADTLERRLELRSRIQTALVYPCLLITLAIVSTAIVLGVLGPAVAPIFAESGKPMPAGLQFIIDLESQWPPILGFFIFLGIFFYWFQSWSASRPNVRSVVDHAILRIPFVGTLKAQHETARFARTLGSMVKAGVPLLQGLESACQAVSNLYLRTQIDGVIESVRNGGSLSKALGHVDRLPAVVPQMTSVGEESGKLADMLLRVAITFERSTERSIERAMGLLTPLLTVMIAGLVGALVLTVMNAVLGINELATQ